MTGGQGSIAARTTSNSRALLPSTRVNPVGMFDIPVEYTIKHRLVEMGNGGGNLTTFLCHTKDLGFQPHQPIESE